MQLEQVGVAVALALSASVQTGPLDDQACGERAIHARLTQGVGHQRSPVVQRDARQPGGHERTPVGTVLRDGGQGSEHLGAGRGRQVIGVADPLTHGRGGVAHESPANGRRTRVLDPGGLGEQLGQRGAVADLGLGIEQPHLGACKVPVSKAQRGEPAKTHQREIVEIVAQGGGQIAVVRSLELGVDRGTSLGCSAAEVGSEARVEVGTPRPDGEHERESRPLLPQVSEIEAVGHTIGQHAGGITDDHRGDGSTRAGQCLS